MPTVSDVLSAVERLAPACYAFSFDHIGLQIGDPSAQVTGVVTTLDCSNGAVDTALASGSNVIVAHHPVIWGPLGTVRADDAKGALVTRLVQSGIALIAAHTNWDCAPGGVNDTLANLLGLADVRPFGSSSDLKTFKLVTFAPTESTQALLDVLTAAGAGKIGLYDRCSFVASGTGTFRGNEGSHPVVGRAGKAESVPEDRIELVVPSTSLGSVVTALRQAHPYEEPAYDLFPLENGNGYPIGRIGHLSTPLSPTAFLEHVSDRLGTVAKVWSHSNADVNTVAVVGGAADSEWPAALALGAQAYVTGEVKHHVALEASAAGITMVQAGHYATEHPGAVALKEALAKAVPGTAVQVFEPGPGQHGRPL